MKFKIICLSLFIFSCGADKNKPYENVNIIREKPGNKKDEVKIYNFPLSFSKSQMLILEVDKSDVEIKSWDLDSMLVDNSFRKMNSSQVEIYQGNNQLILKEKGRRDDLKGNKWQIFVPEYTSLNVKSQNGNLWINSVRGTFMINSPVGDIDVTDCASAMQLKSQSGNIRLKNWELMGRSKVSTASGDLEVDFASDLAYNLSLHSGSGSTVINLNGHELASNLEILTFRGEGKVISDFDMTEAEEFYSDALNRYYDLRKVQIKNTFPMTSISTGNGSITVRK